MLAHIYSNASKVAAVAWMDGSRSYLYAVKGEEHASMGLDQINDCDHTRMPCSMLPEQLKDKKRSLAT